MTLAVADDGATTTATKQVSVGSSGSSSSFTNLEVLDGSTTEKAEFTVDYTVDASGGSFDRVEVTYQYTKDTGNQNTNTQVSTASSDQLTQTGVGNTGGNSATITIELYDTSENVVESYSVTESADGTNQNGDIV